MKLRAAHAWGRAYGMSWALPGSAVAPGPGRSPLASTVALNAGGMQKALTSVDGCGWPSPMHSAGAEPKSVISCSEPGLEDAVPNAPDVRCLHVPHAVVLGHPVIPAHCAFDVHGTGGLAKVGLKDAPQKPQKTSCPFMSVATLWFAALGVAEVVRLNGIGSAPM